MQLQRVQPKQYSSGPPRYQLNLISSQKAQNIQFGGYTIEQTPHNAKVVWIDRAMADARIEVKIPVKGGHHDVICGFDGFALGTINLLDEIKVEPTCIKITPDGLAKKLYFKLPKDEESPSTKDVPQNRAPKSTKELDDEDSQAHFGLTTDSNGPLPDNLFYIHQ